MIKDQTHIINKIPDWACVNTHTHSLIVCSVSSGVQVIRIPTIRNRQGEMGQIWKSWIDLSQPFYSVPPALFQVSSSGCVMPDGVCRNTAWSEVCGPWAVTKPYWEDAHKPGGGMSKYLWKNTHTIIISIIIAFSTYIYPTQGTGVPD